ncbi:hypothetical protein [Roseibium aggregatum]|uniref:hypothetical protein n=1 Tax=Roseibium aggregatum TaxID=187304 RepID=UPI001E63E34C|nr:hypothetical protein [Roseibium aggregatum]UES51182.1 hypothetical protein GFK88_17120 [Roseibium aggregatum]
MTDGEFETEFPEIIGFVGIAADPRTDATEMDMSKVFGAAEYVARWPDGYTETLFTGLDPTTNGGWTLNVIEAAQAWRDAGGVIPTWSPPTQDEIRSNMPPLTARQFRLGLIRSGRTFAQVETAIAAIPDGTERAEAQIEWEYAASFNRMHPLVVSLSTTLGFSPEEVDALWQNSMSL